MSEVSLGVPPHLSKPVTLDSVIDWRLILLVISFVAIIFIAVKTVVQRHEARSLFVEMQTLEKERDVLAAQWSRLKLEQGTVLNQVSVERQARWDLGMKIPKASEVKMIREPVKTYIVETTSADKRISLGD
ncbi:MAG TPA: cell division protein FtsL [Leucothrix mucor]|nr:cell division protein FtsL [Leucothrix mucor]